MTSLLSLFEIERFAGKWGFTLSVVILATFAASCGKRADASKPTPSLEPKTIQTDAVAVKPLKRVVHVTGSISAREQAALSVKVPGRLENISVDIGSVVKKGDLLAQIEHEDYELRVRQAEAALAQARARLGLPLDGVDDTVDVQNTGLIRQAVALLDEATRNRDRIRQLAKDKISSASELDSVEAAYKVAETRRQEALEEIRQRQAILNQRRAELNLARKQLADSNIVAPFDGIIHARRASVGEFLQSGTPLLEIAEVDPLRLRLEVPERESPRIRNGQAIEVIVGTNIFPTEITRVSPILNHSNRMLLVEADLHARPSLRPGLFVEARIIVEENDPALVVPASAISTFVGIEKVFVVQDGKAQEKNVATGRRDGLFVEVVKGLEEGQRVVLNPAKLRSNDPVIEEKHAEAR